MAETMEKIRNNVKSIKHKILVMSGKGGVGKSTVAVNLALALADEGFRTGLMDIDLHGPNVARMVGLKQRPEVIENQIFPPEVLPNLKVIGISSFVEEDAPVVWRGPMKTTAIYQFLGDVAWGELDFLIIDSPPDSFRHNGSCGDDTSGRCRSGREKSDKSCQDHAQNTSWHC
jgi:ATP-binding protein involved in chromosome partitioning